MRTKCGLLVELPDDHQAIKNKWIFKRKTNADGNITVYNAQLVTNGFRQVQGVDYDETFSPVAMLKSVWIMLAIAAFNDYETSDQATTEPRRLTTARTAPEW